MLHDTWDDSWQGFLLMGLTIWMSKTCITIQVLTHTRSTHVVPEIYGQPGADMMLIIMYG